MNRHRFLIIASVVLSSSCAWASRADRPRPDLWERYPRIKQQVDRGLAKLEGALAAFEPEAFAARHPALARMARSADWEQRVRALRAIAALENPAGIPLLVAGIRDAKERQWLACAMHPLTLWIAGRSPRDRFKPLAPLFLDLLVKAQDWPSVRCHCLLAVGNLAGREWLPIVRDLSASRHPAVTHRATWAIQQLSSRPVSKDWLDLTGSSTPDAPCERPTSCTLSEKERAAIVANVLLRTIRCDVPAEADGDKVLYSSDISWFDGWIPMSPSLDSLPTEGIWNYKWRYRAGRVVCCTACPPDAPPYLEQRVWYNRHGAPVCSARYRKDGKPLYIFWADYDDDGLLRRVVELRSDCSPRFVNTFENGPAYRGTIHRRFGADGKLQSTTRYVGGQMIHTNVACGGPTRVHGRVRRVEVINRMTGYGLASFYPIPPAPANPRQEKPSKCPSPPESGG